MKGCFTGRLKFSRVYLLVIFLSSQSWHAMGQPVTVYAVRPSFDETKAAAEAGKPRAQYDLGSMYYYGDRGTNDPVEAAKWFRKAADQNNAAAQTSLGYAYFYGQGVAKDPVEAVKWFRKAASHNEPGAQFFLGVAYA
jgi:uncharacterized protein